ncbi:lycopene cyclase domain-containing protein [Thermogemmatispora carboxidivorans]|uniref:lycopene cyclase domain-containing protein n=1 Tax=Thermogemmatispora carboxidivorans TaxID=1382306 RepID=UPI00069BA1D0|nr:lycopene cyclase domain-containing protein [Thermogemmatispora carboxidivorans]
MVHMTYLLFLLGWALPILGLQWLIGWRKLWARRRRWPWAVLLVGSYLTLADSLAIAQHIWFFQPALILGPTLGNVPLEEALFYFLTAAMIAQGYILLLPASHTSPGPPPRPETETPAN